MVQEKTKIYFASDVHLGMHPVERSAEREKIFISWFDEIKNDAREIYLVGDIFDYWFEYRKAVPRGFTRTLGKLSEMADLGIPVHFFTGNHDVWVFDYLPTETGVILHTGPYITTLGSRKFFIAHGDGLGPGEEHYKLMKRFFTSKTLQWLYARLHPNFTIALAQRWSRNSRYAKGVSVDFLGADKEILIQFAREKLKEEHFDYFVFGHRHIPLDFPLDESSQLIFLGDWIINFTYAVWDGGKLELKKFIPS
jgi:UDP-2,3-diacylglucosamine hydrolase